MLLIMGKKVVEIFFRMFEIYYIFNKIINGIYNFSMWKLRT